MAPSTHVAPSVETIVALHHLHPLAKVDLLPFVNDIHLETDFVLDGEAFIFALTCSPRFSSDSPPSMVYELLRDCFVPNNYVSGFEFFF
jgi:hypothetical protein